MDDSISSPSPQAVPRVALGTHVEVDLVDEQGGVEHLSLDVVPKEEADVSQGRLSAEAPLARTILGRPAGSTAPYHMGDVVAVRICRVGPRVSSEAGDTSARQQAIMQRAVARSEMINDMAFALAAGSKWGDYDPSKLAGLDDEEAK